MQEIYTQGVDPRAQRPLRVNIERPKIFGISKCEEIYGKRLMLAVVVIMVYGQNFSQIL